MYFPLGYDYKVQPFLSKSEYRIFMSVIWLLILSCTTLIGLVLANIWQILIKQGLWKTPPLLLFYIFFFIALVTREYDLIMLD